MITSRQRYIHVVSRIHEFVLSFSVYQRSFPSGLYNGRASPRNLPAAFEWPLKSKHVRSSVVDLQCSVIPTVSPTQHTPL
jgi:hypothetical protein